MDLKQPIADTTLLEAFADTARPVFDRVYGNCSQAQSLTQLRDTLLLRWISGQLRWPEAEAIVKEAV